MKIKRTVPQIVRVTQNNRRRGYTLMEIITVTLVIAVVASVTMPAADGFMTSQQVAAQASVLTGDVRYARSWAMSEQVFCRLVFSNEKLTWVVQEHCVGGEPHVGEPTTTWASEPANTYTADPLYWRSIIDYPEREVEGAFDVALTPDVNPTAIFFRPDGMMVSGASSNHAPIAVIKARFTSGDIGVDVNISPNGALESMEYYSEDY